MANGLRAALQQRLADGAWHRVDALAVAVGGVIRPESAVRHYRRHGGKRDVPLAVQVLTGRRWMVSLALRRLGCERWPPGWPRLDEARVRWPASAEGGSDG